MVIIVAYCRCLVAFLCSDVEQMCEILVLKMSSLFTQTDEIFTFNLIYRLYFSMCDITFQYLNIVVWFTSSFMTQLIYYLDLYSWSRSPVDLNNTLLLIMSQRWLSGCSDCSRLQWNLIYTGKDVRNMMLNIT